MKTFGRPSRQEIFERLTPMNRGAIPDDEQLPRNLAQQKAQKANDIGPFVGFALHLHKQASIRANGSNHREMIMDQRRT